MNDTILLAHGSGGELTHELIQKLFLKYFQSPVLKSLADSALMKTDQKHLAFTTDSFVIDPIFFPGGDIGKLAVCGTVNDLAVSGAIPKYLSVGLIIEEGLPMKDLEIIIKSMAKEARYAGVEIVTGDTKIVERGKCDKIFINTSGLGILNKQFTHISSGKKIRSGDSIIVSGTIGDHGMAVLSKRENLLLNSKLKSDCACLNHLIQDLLRASLKIVFMRDPTRGGLATVLSEIALKTGLGIEIWERMIPIKENVKGMCELIGFDPLYVANEGKVVMIVRKEDAGKTIEVLRKNELGKKSEIIGHIVNDHKGRVVSNTEIGGKRIINMLTGEQLPRIC